jgi:hypothetical protein
MIVEYFPEQRVPKRVSSWQIGSLILQPGPNDIPKVDFEAIRSDPKFAPFIEQALDERYLAIVRDDSGADEIDITNLDVYRACRLVQGSFDKALLTKWQDLDVREGVQRAIKKQLESLQPPAEAKKTPATAAK